jgi:hypothetical protein
MSFLPFLNFEHVALLFDSVACSFERPPQRSARVMTELVDGVPLLPPGSKFSSEKKMTRENRPPALSANHYEAKSTVSSSIRCSRGKTIS